MANALEVLLNLAKQRPSATAQVNAPYDEMVSDYALKDVQGAIGEQGRQGGSPYYVPSRDELRQQGMAELKKLFGTLQAQGEAKAVPERIKGEYGLAGAQIRAQEAANRAKEADAQRQTQRDFQAEQNRLGREAVAGRQTSGFEAQNTRAEAAQRAAKERQTYGAQLQGERDKTLGKVKDTGPNAFQRLLQSIGVLSPSEPAAGASSEAATFAQQHYGDLAGLPDEQILQSLQNDQPDASPDELQQMLQGIQGLRR